MLVKACKLSFSHRPLELFEHNPPAPLFGVPLCGRFNVTIRARVLAVALTSSICVLSPNVAQAQWPDIREAKAIAEEGFIYGLPIVMNYAVMSEYSVDKNSGQFKAPFNQISNEARVFTYKDTAVITPNSDTPYSILWLDLRAEPIVLSVPA